MDEDKEKISKLLLEYIKIIISEYGKNIRPNVLDKVLNSNLVEFNDNNSISFNVSNNILYLPKHVYDIFPMLEANPNYGIEPDNCRKSEEYLDTNTTYFDYIDHFLKAGLTPYKYFEESLLHEALHLCGGQGGNPLEEGINELKTRELAQKYNIKISGYGYPKEVEVAKKLQDILGKDIMDELEFMDRRDKYDFLVNKVGIEKADLYNKVSHDMINQSENFNGKILNISDPYEKADVYSKIDYSGILNYLDDYIGKTR